MTHSSANPEYFVNMYRLNKERFVEISPRIDLFTLRRMTSYLTAWEVLDLKTLVKDEL